MELRWVWDGTGTGIGMTGSGIGSSGSGSFVRALHSLVVPNPLPEREAPTARCAQSRVQAYPCPLRSRTSSHPSGNFPSRFTTPSDGGTES